MSITVLDYRGTSSSYYGLRVCLSVDGDMRQHYFSLADADKQEVARAWEKARELEAQWAKERGRSTDARYRELDSRNISGIVGLAWRYGFRGDSYTLENAILAYWTKDDDRQARKSFSIRKYGLRCAFELAAKARSVATRGRERTPDEIDAALREFLPFYALVTEERLADLEREVFKECTLA